MWPYKTSQLLHLLCCSTSGKGGEVWVVGGGGIIGSEMGDREIKGKG